MRGRPFKALLIAATLVSTNSFPDSYPNRPIRIIVPGAAGGVLDVNVRRVADRLSLSLGQPVVVDNRPGASGNLGADAAARSKADGYTLFIGSANIICVNPVIFPKLTYSPGEDFVPITLATKGSPILLVNPQVPANTFAEFVAYAKSHPAQLFFGTPGPGTPQHLAGELLKKLTGVQMDYVPYKAQPQVLTDLIGGQIQVTIEFPSIAVPYVKSGQLRALVIVGPKRKPVLPDVPTAAEVGVPGLSMTSWNGYFAPKGTPSEIISRLQKELAALIKGKDFSELSFPRNFVFQA